MQNYVGIKKQVYRCYFQDKAQGNFYKWTGLGLGGVSVKETMLNALKFCSICVMEFSVGSCFYISYKVAHELVYKSFSSSLYQRSCYAATGKKKSEIIAHNYESLGKVFLLFIW